nr:flagellar type III secretion system protein FlhB [Escherichia coli]
MFNRIRISTTLFLILILCGILQIGSNGMSFWAFRDDLQRLNQVEQSNQQRAALAQTRAVMLQASTTLNKAGTLTALSYPADDIKTLMTTARASLTQSTTLFKSFMAMTAGNEHVRALQKETEKSFARWHNDLEHQATWLESNQLSDFLTAPVQGSQNAFDVNFEAWQLEIIHVLEAASAQSQRNYQISALLPLISGVVLVALISPVMLGGLVFSGKSLQPKFSKLNPLPGIKRMFSAQTGAELLKAILKTILVGSVTGFFLWHHWPHMMRLMAESPITAMGNAMDLVGLCALLVVLGVIPMVGFDVFFQIFSHLKKLRMSRQDIRDEFKQSEGDPHVKGRIRQMQRAAARRRMMADVPKADVIVNNPTHYSVALQYDENKMSAPKVVAKGAGLVALRIREIGAENNVPTLEAPPLARALYRHVEIGQQIPGQLYAAVAEVLAWVWQLKRWRLAGGQRPVQPTHLPVPEALDFINEKPTHE